MEANREAALKCRELAQKYFREGKLAMCIKYCDKCTRLAGSELAGIADLKACGRGAARERLRTRARDQRLATSLLFGRTGSFVSFASCGAHQDACPGS